MLCTFLLTAFGAFYFPVRNGGHTACKSAILAVLEVPFPTSEMCLLWIKYFTCSDLPEWLQLIDNCEFVSLKNGSYVSFHCNLCNCL